MGLMIRMVKKRLTSACHQNSNIVPENPVVICIDRICSLDVSHKNKLMDQILPFNRPYDFIAKASSPLISQTLSVENFILFF